jgi:hypothetical protein
MSHFAEIDDNNIVTRVIVAEQDFIDTGAVGDPSKWIQTSYNTRGGVHYGQDGNPDGGEALRKNYAGIGYTYDAGRDAFIPPKPFDSWTLDEETCYWNPPTPMPNDITKIWTWNETTQSWDGTDLPTQ